MSNFLTFHRYFANVSCRRFYQHVQQSKKTQIYEDENEHNIDINNVVLSSSPNDYQLELVFGFLKNCYDHTRISVTDSANIIHQYLPRQYRFNLRYSDVDYDPSIFDINCGVKQHIKQKIKSRDMKNKQRYGITNFYLTNSGIINEYSKETGHTLTNVHVHKTVFITSR